MAAQKIVSKLGASGLMTIVPASFVKVSASFRHQPAQEFDEFPDKGVNSGGDPEIASNNQARATAHWRFAVANEIPKQAAVCSSDSPAKYRSLTSSALAGSRKA